MPLNQLLLHLSNDWFGTRLFDGAAHRYNKACVPNQLGRKGLGLIGGDVYSAFSHHVYNGRIDPTRRYCARALRIHPMLLGEGLGHLASSRILNTDKQHGTLANLGPLKESESESGN